MARSSGLIHWSPSCHLPIVPRSKRHFSPFTAVSIGLREFLSIEERRCETSAGTQCRFLAESAFSRDAFSFPFRDAGPDRWARARFTLRARCAFRRVLLDRIEHQAKFRHGTFFFFARPAPSATRVSRKIRESAARGVLVELDLLNLEFIDTIPYHIDMDTIRKHFFGGQVV